MCLFLMIRRPPRATRTDTLFPSTTLFRAFYLTMLDMLERYGYVRPSWQSPFSFAQELAQAQPLKFDPVIALTELFYEIRFGQRPIERSEENTSELQSLMRISYAVFCVKQKKNKRSTTTHRLNTNIKT